LRDRHRRRDNINMDNMYVLDVSVWTEHICVKMSSHRHGNKSSGFLKGE
jgi:hypothetical protein